jgi:predicted peroxiredoxin
MRRDIKQEDVIDGVRIAGAAAFVEECLTEGVQALVY